MSLEINALSLRLGRNQILDHVDIEVPPGAIVGVLGPNGAGKSSLLKAASGEWTAESGDVVINERPLGAWALIEKARTVGVLPQQSNLEFAFSVTEVVMLGRIPHDSGRARDEAIARDALARVDAQHLAERLFTQLSGGEKQRVQLARILAQVWESSPFGSRYLLLDEPTASFDLAHQQLMIDVMRHFANAGVGVLIVLHDLNLAARLAHTIVMLKAGQIQAMGAPEKVLTPEIIAEVFAVDATVGIHPQSRGPMVIL